MPFNRATDIFPGGGSSVPFQLTAVNGALFFIADDGITGVELWKHDPATGLTARVADVFPGGSSSFPAELTAVNGALFFDAADGSTGIELWKHDPPTRMTTGIDILVWSRNWNARPRASLGPCLCHARPLEFTPLCRKEFNSSMRSSLKSGHGLRAPACGCWRRSRTPGPCRNAAPPP